MPASSRTIYGVSRYADQAYPTLIRNLVPTDIRGFMLAAIAGAVISSLASMLNSASTIFTMDIYQRYFHAGASQRTLVYVGRGATLLFVVIACLIAPFLGNERFGGIFNYIQEFQGYISPGILAAFVFGFLVKRAPRAAGAVALLVSAPIYGFLQWRSRHRLPEPHITLAVAFLVSNHDATAANPDLETAARPHADRKAYRPTGAWQWLY